MIKLAFKGLKLWKKYWMFGSFEQRGSGLRDLFKKKKKAVKNVDVWWFNSSFLCVCFSREASGLIKYKQIDISSQDYKLH